MQQAIDILEKLRNKVINRQGPNDTDYTRLAELSLLEEIRSEFLALGDGWISTAVKLPPEDTNVLIFEGGQSNLSGWNEPKIGWYNKKFGFQSLTDYHIVTHWMPIPLPPKQ